MKAGVADQFSAAGMDEMKACGIDVMFDPSLNGDSLKAAMAEHKPDILVVRSTKVTPEIIDANPNLKVVMRAGAGYDTIDVAHCSTKGIYVCNCPGKNANAVSELAMCLILSIDRRTAEANAMLKEGKWNKGMFLTQKGIKGRTIGIIGFGNIGQLVCQAAKAFGMEVLVHSRTEHPALAASLGTTYVSMDELLARSDIVSVHTPKTP